MPSEKRVIYLRVELHAVKPSAGVLKRRNRTALGFAYHRESLRQRGNLVRMAHKANMLLVNSVKKQRFFELYLSLTVFAGVRAFNPAAEHIAHQLRTVANSQNRNTQPEYLLVNLRRALAVNAVGSAGKYNALQIFLRFQLCQIRCTRDKLTVNIRLPDPARNQLVILPAEIYNYYLLVCHFFLRSAL